MPFPTIYADETCPLDGYAGYTFRILANPTGATKDDWAFGNLGAINCAECAKMAQPDAERRYCADCTRQRERFGRACAAIYGASHVEGFDFSSVAAALATLEQDGMPDELLAWLFMAPAAIWAKRSDELKKKLTLPLAANNGSL